MDDQEIFGCPVCDAPEEEMCTTPNGTPRNDHKRRVERTYPCSFTYIGVPRGDLP